MKIDKEFPFTSFPYHLIIRRYC